MNLLREITLLLCSPRIRSDLSIDIADICYRGIRNSGVLSTFFLLRRNWKSKFFRKFVELIFTANGKKLINSFHRNSFRSFTLVHLSLTQTNTSLELQQGKLRANQNQNSSFFSLSFCVLFSCRYISRYRCFDTFPNSSHERNEYTRNIAD